LETGYVGVRRYKGLETPEYWNRSNFWNILFCAEY
jgi:hypothetical protein